MSSIILNHVGHPEPPSDVRRRLRAVHPGLDIKYIPGSIEGYWIVSYDWDRDDPRREMIRRGEVSAQDAWDIMCYLPMDMSVAEAPAFIERTMRRHSREEVRNMGAALLKANDQALDGHVNEAIEEVFSLPNPSVVAPRKVTGRRTKHPGKGSG